MPCSTSLLNLPAEILDAICQQLCDQRPTPTDDREAPGSHVLDDMDTENAVVISSALYAISQTCSTLRAVARPFLYKSPLPKRPDMVSDRNAMQQSPSAAKFCGRLTLLARTLFENPELRPCVKSLHLDATCWADGAGFGEGSPLRDVVTRAFENMKDRFEAPAHQHWPLPDCEASGDPEQECLIANTVMVLILLCHLPNVETLAISKWQGSRTPQLQSDTLRSLRRLTVAEEEPTSTGRDNYSTSAFVQTILSAAPNVQSLTMRGAHRSVPIMVHRSISELTLRDCQVPRGELRALMAGFPCLQSLSMIHCSYSGWLRVRLLDGLLLRQNTLKHLKIDLKATPPYRDYGCFRRPAVDAIAGLSNLEILELSGPFGDDLSSSREPNSYFEGFIPRSIRYLSLASGGGGALARYHYDIRHLVQVAGVQYPQLQGLAFEIHCHKCFLPVNSATESDCRHCANLRRSDKDLSHDLEMNGIERLDASDLSKVR